MNTKRKMKAAARRMAIAADAALIRAGQAAEQRQRARALRAALTSAAKATAVAATTAAAVVGVRAAARSRWREEPKETA